MDRRLWQAAYEVYLQDKYRLGLPQWLQQQRLEALASLAQTMLEAVERGYWVPPGRVVQALRTLPALGPSKEGRKGSRGVEVNLVPVAHPGRGRDLAAPFAPRLPAAPRHGEQGRPYSPVSSHPIVAGLKMEAERWRPPGPPGSQRDSLGPAMAAMIVLFALGFLRRRKG